MFTKWDPLGSVKLCFLMGATQGQLNARITGCLLCCALKSSNSCLFHTRTLILTCLLSVNSLLRVSFLFLHSRKLAICNLMIAKCIRPTVSTSPLHACSLIVTSSPPESQERIWGQLQDKMHTFSFSFSFILHILFKIRPCKSLARISSRDAYDLKKNRRSGEHSYNIHTRTANLNTSAFMSNKCLDKLPNGFYNAYLKRVHVSSNRYADHNIFHTIGRGVVQVLMIGLTHGL